MIQLLANLATLVAIAAPLIVGAWFIASSDEMHRRRQRRHDAWMRRISKTYNRGGESARGTP